MTDLSVLLAQERRWIDRQTGVLAALATRGKEIQDRVEKAKLADAELEKACLLITSIAEARTESALRTLEELATAGLRAVFGEDLALKINLQQKGRSQSAEITIVSGGLETAVLDARGGGVAAVAGLMLRIATLLMTPSLQRVLVLDETVAQLSEDYEPALSDFLRDLCQRAGLQIVMVTHSRALAESADHVVTVRQAAGRTELVAASPVE